MANTKRQEILVVEDDQAMAEFVSMRLSSVGFEVHTEGAGAAALSYAAEHRPDLIILDSTLPDFGGYEVCKQLRKIYHPWDVPILMLTAMDKPIDELRGFAHGADAYLTKPYDSNELLQTVALLLGETTPT
jgi:DNA-binding response OmpR family regulator